MDLEIEPVCKYLCHAPDETELQMLFKAEISKEVEPRQAGFNVNREEILQGKFFSKTELKKSVKKGEIRLSFMGKVALERLGWL